MQTNHSQPTALIHGMLAQPYTKSLNIHTLQLTIHGLQLLLFWTVTCRNLLLIQLIAVEELCSFSSGSGTKKKCVERGISDYGFRN